MFEFSNISTYQDELHSDRITCREAVNYFLKKIEQHKQLNAVIDVFAEESLERADTLDQKRKSCATLGKLHGVVITLKDVICYKDHEVKAASKILKNFVSIYNSTAVQKLLDEDAIIIGNCNCDEFAMGNTNENTIYGPVKNALDEKKVPGGSSGGSAVAVQAGFCMASLGSDTGGSVRQPADFCGIVGIKPSYGTISRHGLLAYASSFDQIGVFANNVEDAAAVIEVISGKDAFDSTVNQAPSLILNVSNVDPNKKFKFAVFSNVMNHPSLDGEIRSSIEKTAQQLKDLGHEVAEIDFDLINYIVPAYYILTTAEASSNLSRYDGIRYGLAENEKVEDIADYYKKTRGKGFSKEVKKRIMLGTFVLCEGFYDAYYTKAQQVRRLLSDYTNGIFEKFDAILMPTVPTTAFDAGKIASDPIEGYLADIYTVYANLTGIAGISIPLYQHSNGMPFGLQVLANKQNEVTLIDISKYLEANFKKY